MLMRPPGMTLCKLYGTGPVGRSGFGAWLLTFTSAGIVNRLVLWPRPAHDPAYEVEGASEIQDHVSRRELAGVRASARPTR